jgi:hypothetical protein
MRDRAEGRKRSDSAMKYRCSQSIVDYLAVQLNFCAGSVDARFGPLSVIRRDFAYDSHQPRIPMDDRNQVTNRPVLQACFETAIDDALRSIQTHQVANDSWRQEFAPLF